MTQGERIAADLRRAWNGAPWHGPSVAEVLGRLIARQAAARRSRSSHTPWQLVLHLVTWVDTPLRRIDDPAYAPPEGADFPEPSSTSDDQWRLDVARLGAVVEELAQRVAVMPDEALAALVGGHGYTYTTMMDGVAQHLAYHAGQVAILALKKEEVPNVLVPAPFIPLSALLVGEGLRLFSGVEWRLGWPLWPGIALIAAGGALAYWAHEHFVQQRTPAAPWQAARHLVLAGPYRIMRNPMYLGFLLAQAGMGVLRNNPWDLLLLVPSWALLHWGVVLREERYLRKKFGAPYEELLGSTRRWLI
ncbi:MAG TPA: methyltransferase [Gemmatimonadaceae bacterium]